LTSETLPNDRPQAVQRGKHPSAVHRVLMHSVAKPVVFVLGNDSLPRRCARGVSGYKFPPLGCTLQRNAIHVQNVIKSVRHKGLQAYFERGTKAGIQAAHAPKLAQFLARLDAAQVSDDMNLPGWDLHPLHGNLANHCAVSVNGNWRMTFMFEGTDVVLLDCLDYH